MVKRKDTLDDVNPFGDSTLPYGLLHIVKGYDDYASEVIIERALPNIDGFKPVNRRIVYTLKNEKAVEFTKSANIVGATMKLHPHGDGAIYEALVRMVDSAGYYNVPFIKGHGSFGSVYDETKYAASRYTECKLAPLTNEIFKGMAGVNMIPSYDNSKSEPELLPVPFPNLFCNATQGIAVGLASNIPSFNFNELNDAVIELIQTGKIAKPLCPDFTTGGYYIRNDEELKALMETGRASLKFRGKWYIDGKSIIITEIPYYTTLEQIKRDAEKIQNVTNVNDKSDINGMGLVIDCNSRKAVDYVLTEVIKSTKLQMPIKSNIAAIYRGEPKVCGITEMLGYWIEFRTDCIKRELGVNLNAVNAGIENYEVLVKLLSDADLRKDFIEELTVSESRGRTFLYDHFEGVKESTIDWIIGLSLRSISNVQGKINHLQKLYAEKADIEKDLANIDAVIIRQLQYLNQTYRYPRKTEVTDTDYVFEKSDAVVKAEAVPVLVQFKDKFIKKLRYSPLFVSDAGIRCMSDDIISCVDDNGRLIRIYLENIPFNDSADLGTYIPVYLDEEDAFQILCYDLVGDWERCYLFKDGYVGVIDYSEWSKESGRKVRVTENGISGKAQDIIGEVDLNKEYVLLMTESKKLAFAATDFKHKHRTARTKLIDTKGDDINICLPLSMQEFCDVCKNPQRYMGKFSKVRPEDEVDYELINKLLREI